jgi:hypothetical protein
MRKNLAIILFTLLALTGCNKDNPKTSGEVTIDNMLYGSGPYYALGFSFSKAEKISTLSDPEPDLTIDNDGTLGNLILQTNNYQNSFYKAGEFANESQASMIFYNLTSFTVPEWKVWADSIRPNQVWIYRSGTEHYAKIRIISTISETRSGRDYAECTFEWVYQPDGTLTFPGK